MSIDEIEERRVELKISQAELCAAAGIDPSTYTKLRQDAQRAARPRTVRKLAAALGRFASEQAQERAA